MLGEVEPPDDVEELLLLLGAPLGRDGVQGLVELLVGRRERVAQQEGPVQQVLVKALEALFQGRSLSSKRLQDLLQRGGRIINRTPVSHVCRFAKKNPLGSSFLPKKSVWHFSSTALPCAIFRRNILFIWKLHGK